VPQLALPQVLEGDEEVLEICGGSIALLCQKVRNRIDVHGGGSGIALGVCWEGMRDGNYQSTAICLSGDSRQYKARGKGGSGKRVPGRCCCVRDRDLFRFAVSQPDLSSALLACSLALALFRTLPSLEAERATTSTPRDSSPSLSQLILSTTSIMQAACARTKTSLSCSWSVLSNAPLKRYISDISITRTGKPIIRTQGGRSVLFSLRQLVLCSFLLL